MRDELIAALRGRIEETERSGDPASILTGEALAEADQLLGHLAATPDLDSEIAYVAGIFHLLRATACQAAGQDAEPDEAMAAVLLVPVYFALPDVLPEPVRAVIAGIVEGPPEHVLAESRNNLAMLLMQRRVRLGEELGVAPAANLLRLAADGLPPGHPSRAEVLCNLGYARLLSAPDGTPAPADAEEIIAVFRESLAHLPEADPNRSRCANGLALALRAKATPDRDITLLVESIENFRLAVRTAADGDENLPNVLTCLAESLLAWWTEAPDADQAAPDEAIAALERATLATPPGSPEFAQRTALLEQSHLARATRDSRVRASRPNAQALDESIAAVNEVLGVSDDGVHGLARLLGLTDATGHAGQLAEFNEVLQQYPFQASLADVRRKATDIRSRRFDDLDPDQIPAAVTAGLFDDSGPARQPIDVSSLTEIVDLHERLLRELPEDDPDRTVVQLTHNLLSMVKLSADLEPTEESMDRASGELARLIGKLPEMIQGMSRTTALPDFSMKTIEQASSLGHALLSPFESMAVIDREAKRYRRKLDELSADDPDFVPTTRYLAHTLFARCEFTAEDDVFAEAVALTRRVVAATSAPKLVSAWGKTAANRLYQSGWTGPARSSGLAAMAASGAANAVAGGDPGGALESLDDGRAIMLHGAQRTRGELDQLRRADPALAERLIGLRARITADLNPGMEPRPGGVEQFRARMAEWSELVERAKALPGFERFLGQATTGLPELAPAAADGPVVVVNVAARRCDALVLRDGRVRAVPLPDLRSDELSEQTEAFSDAIAVLSGQSTVDATLVAGSARRMVTDTLSWLWDVLAEPVLTDLGLTEHDPAEPWPRVWWSPTGPLTFLPLHAAGRHDEPGASVLDRVVSSYTPTVRALLHSRARTTSRERTAFAVAMPETPGHATLPETVREATAFAAAHPGRPPLSGATATRAAVRDALPHAAIAHFACHASSDPRDATSSHLLLHDGPLTVTEISRLELDGAELAYLSACATARGSTALADEAVHMASAFQLAGFAQAVGTLWEVRDDTAAAIAGDFHRELVQTIADPVRPAGALALHTAVRKLRATPGAQPWEWAAHVHAGA